MTDGLTIVGNNSQTYQNLQKAMLKHWLAGLPAVLMNFTASSMPLDSLDTFTWSHRLVLVFSEEHNFQSMHTTLDKLQAEVEDRHIIWFVISERNMKTNFTGEIDPHLQESLARQWIDRNNARTEVILIGKDGDEKLRSNRLDLGDIFGAIDSMPMRQYEMKNTTGE